MAIFEGQDVEPVDPPEDNASAASGMFRWGTVLFPLGLLAAIGGGLGVALFLRHRREEEESEVGAQ